MRRLLRWWQLNVNEMINSMLTKYNQPYLLMTKYWRQNIEACHFGFPGKLKWYLHLLIKYTKLNKISFCFQDASRMWFRYPDSAPSSYHLECSWSQILKPSLPDFIQIYPHWIILFILEKVAEQPLEEWYLDYWKYLK